jgi:adenylate kinase
MNVILLGPPGAGKGTQAKLLEQKFSLKQLSSGDMLRAAVHAHSPVGKQAKAFMDKGALVPDELVEEIVFEHLASMKDSKGFILDGFPRTVAQAEALDDWLEKRGSAIDRVVAIQVRDELLVDRIAGRFTCAKCGEGYHDSFKRPAHDGTCDKCGSHEFKRRADDDPDKVKTRLTEYHTQTAPLINYYKKRDKVALIDGEAPIETVSRQIDDVFSENAAG